MSQHISSNGTTLSDIVNSAAGVESMVWDNATSFDWPNGTDWENTTTSDYPSSIVWDASTVAILIASCVLILGTVLDNTLVCVAVAVVDRLRRCPSNLLIASLAVSDMLVACLVMPPAAVFELSRRRWTLGIAVCTIWTSLDVLLCTASILNICAISIDRYLMITRPLRYAFRRKRAVVGMLVGVWMAALVVSVPSMYLRRRDVQEKVQNETVCHVSDDIGYQMYATIFSFYLPLLVMLVVYCKIYRVSSRIARTEIKSRKASLDVQGKMMKRKQSMEGRSTTSNMPEDGVEGCNRSEGCNMSEGSKLINNSNNINNINSINSNNSSNNSSGYSSSMSTTTTSPCNSFTSNSVLDSRKNSAATTSDSETKFGQLLQTKTNNDSELNDRWNWPISIDVTSVQKPEVVTGSNDMQLPRLDGIKNTEHSTQIVRTSSGSSRLGDVIRRLNSTVSSLRSSSLKFKERKATKTLGVIMGVFIACWLPFFILVLVRTFASDDTVIPPTLSSVLLWLGYLNSFLNPLIYARFNRDFQRPFRDIIFGKCRGINLRQLHEDYLESCGTPRHLSNVANETDCCYKKLLRNVKSLS